MGNHVRISVSHHHSPEEGTFAIRRVADLEAAGGCVGRCRRSGRGEFPATDIQRAYARTWRSSAAKDYTSETKMQLVCYAYVPW
jgi:hypothetical protein